MTVDEAVTAFYDLYIEKHQSMPSTQALLFMPDISGFTEFVTNTEIEHSRHIISELLELLIDADELGLTLAEIEGDALFFYREGELPSREALFRQIENMFLAFHNHLTAYKYRRICRCGACTTASGLKLKFVAHAGAIDFMEVKESSKPFGPHVILAHRLLKNSIGRKEYALLSEDLHERLKTDTTLTVRLHDDAGEGSETYDAGTVDYCYFPLESLKEFIEASDNYDAGEKVANPWVHTMVINAPVEEIYDLVSNFDRRSEWNQSVDRFEYEKDRVNRVGTKHKCVVDDRLINFETIIADFGGKWVYGERTTDVPVIDSLNSYFILEPIDHKHTKVTVEVHPIAGSFAKKAFIPVLKFLSWSRFKKQINLLKPAAEKK